MCESLHTALYTHMHTHKCEVHGKVAKPQSFNSSCHTQPHPPASQPHPPTLSLPSHLLCPPPHKNPAKGNNAHFPALIFKLNRVLLSKCKTKKLRVSLSRSIPHAAWSLCRPGLEKSLISPGTESFGDPLEKATLRHTDIAQMLISGGFHVKPQISGS